MALRVLRGFSFVAVVSSAAACGPNSDDQGGGDGASLESLASQQCTLLYNCGCLPDEEQQNLEQQNACRDQLLGLYEYSQETAEAAGLEFDGECAQRQHDWWSAVSCGWPTDEDIGTASCALDCPLWYGKVGPGEACQVVADRASDCAQGLDCVGGVCADQCGNWRLAEGAKCYDPVDPPTGTCVDGAYCDVGGTDRCQPVPASGQPCPQGVCDESLWCNAYAEPEAICESLKPTGSTCDTDQACVTGYCIDQRCAPLPDVGEPCYLECSGDLACASGVCTVPQQEGQSCASLPCGAELVCLEGVCQQGVPWVCQGYF